MFYLVWRENGGLPSKKHDSLEAAQAEARRLATLHMGIKFHIMEHKQTISASPLFEES